MPHVHFPTPIGACEITWNETHVLGFRLPEASASGSTTSVVVEDRNGDRETIPPWIEQIIQRVGQHFAGRYQDFSDLPYEWSRVSEFQQGVYHQTLAIKAGFTKSYGEIARLLGLGSEASRAVGVALGLNPWPLLVPCHRVVSASNKMTGFSAPGGIRTKTRLLALEGAELLSE